MSFHAPSADAPDSDKAACLRELLRWLHEQLDVARAIDAWPTFDEKLPQVEAVELQATGTGDDVDRPPVSGQRSTSESSGVNSQMK